MEPASFGSISSDQGEGDDPPVDPDRKALGSAELGAIDHEGLRRRLLERVEARKETLARLLENAGSIHFEEDRVVLVFAESQAFARKRVEQDGNLVTVRAAASDAAGRRLGVEVRREGSEGATARLDPPKDDPGEERSGWADRAAEPGKTQGGSPPRSSGTGEIADDGNSVRSPGRPSGTRGPDASEEPGAAPPGGSRKLDDEPVVRSGPTSAATPERAAGGKHERLVSQALEDPVVRKLVERFGAKIVEVKEVP